MLSHLILRRAAVAALAFRGANGTWATLAEDRVYDSRIDSFDKFSDDEARIAITVYTEESKGESQSAANGFPFNSSVELVIEVGARQRVSVDAQGEGGGIIDLALPGADPVLEAAIDVCVSQIVHRLATRAFPAFWKARRRISAIASTPYRESDGGIKLAVRSLALTCQVADEATPDQADAIAALLPKSSNVGGGRDLLARAAAAIRSTIALDGHEPLDGIDATAMPAGAHPGTPVTSFIVGGTPNP